MSKASEVTSSAVKQGQGQPKKSNTMSATRPREKKPQVSWFVEREDGNSDINIVAIWCSELDNFNLW
ncbi:hypothetical protein CROQUDRAFT_662863 [Cronartium quercuum f. sp. fusiforme G11]|uniref:Uncharacterized protein n=1 Tax=Cronartium quercuum f. sp. fusiforme G11 TaxID=708437 RepID=A0A9P6NDJ9_9BASI|nr:hypothetical protein CROQUDRAFT_662863 [Cronartium quercuum f. sp. fusiforme G11]